jgi:acyl-CoA reductase-like NAD-dependent aldehyde dehydrogenase
MNQEQAAAQYRQVAVMKLPVEERERLISKIVELEAEKRELLRELLDKEEEED